jgi:nucleoside phosphorylase
MPLSQGDYTVACICPMGVELAPVQAMLDRTHPSLPTQRDQNHYTLGEMKGHNIVIAVLPEIGTNAAATVAIQLLNDFPSVRFGLLVGIGGGVPDEEEGGDDIRLGDVVVSKSTDTFGGVVQYDMGKQTAEGFKRTGTLNKPPGILQSAVQTLLARHEREDSRISHYLVEMVDKFPKMNEKYTYPRQAEDQLFKSTYNHQGGHTCSRCDIAKIIQRPHRAFSDPYIHYGTIGSANQVVNDGTERDKLKGEIKILCVEMEAAGLMDSFPCLVIRGICDYADSHKNKKWQPYAAAVAAAYMKELLSVIPPKDVAKVSPAADMVQIPSECTGRVLPLSY